MFIIMMMMMMIIFIFISLLLNRSWQNDRALKRCQEKLRVIAKRKKQIVTELYIKYIVMKN